MSEALLARVNNGYLARNSLFQPLTFPIVIDDVTTAFGVNPKYDSSLDPMTCSDGTKYSWSTQAFLDLCPENTLEDNAYLMPKPEIMSRIFFTLNSVTDWDQLNFDQVYALIKMYIHGLIALPIDKEKTAYAIIQPHAKTAAEFDTALAEFLNTAEFAKDNRAPEGLTFNSKGKDTGATVVPADDKYNLQKSGSLGVWLKMVGAAKGSGILQKGDERLDEVSYAIREGSSPRTIDFILYNEHGQFQTITTANPIKNNEWFFVVATWTPSKLYLYINGELDTEAVNSIGSVRISEGDLFIGARYEDQGKKKDNLTFKGALDGIMILPHSTCPTAIKAWYEEDKEEYANRK